MAFIKLSDDEVSKLSFDEFIKYSNELSQYLAGKEMEKWNSMTIEQRDKYTLENQKEVISKRDGTDLTFEGILALAQVDFDLDLINENFPINIVQQILSIKKRLTDDEMFTFFWSTTSPFSQWHKAKFSAPTFMMRLGNDEFKKEGLLAGMFPMDKQEYTSAEQFMMYHKAMIFLDREIASEIMSTTDVKKIKALGRSVQNFDEDVWKYYRSLIVYEGNKQKFLQNEDLRIHLLNTQNTTIVEAASNDKIWGIGLDENDSNALKRSTWKGENLLGEILTQLRVELAGMY